MIRFLLFSTLLLHGCAGQPSHPIKLLGNRIATYVQAVSDEGIFSNPYGDVYSVSLDTSQLERVTNDSFFDDSPALSNTGRRIAFLSNREGNRVQLDVRGSSNPHEIVILDLDTGLQTTVAAKLTSSLREELANASCLAWGQRHNELIVGLTTGKILHFDLATHSIKLIHDLADSDASITNLAVSPDYMSLAFTYSASKARGEGLSVVRLQDSAAIDVVRNGRYLILGSWTPDGKRLLFRQSDFFFWTIDDNRTELLPIPDDVKSIMVERVFPLSNHSFVFLGRVAGHHTSSVDIATFSLTDSQVSWITNNRKPKTSLGVVAIH